MKLRLPLLLLVLLVAATVHAQTVLLEPFNAGIPPTWTVVDGGGSTHTWVGTTAGYNGNTLDGTQFAFVNSDAAGNAPHPLLSEQLVSPAVNVTGASQLLLEWDQYYRVYSNDRGYVEVWNGSAWVTVLTISANSGAWGAASHQQLNITAYANAALKVRFRYEDNNVWAWWWAVDNVQIRIPAAQEAQLETVVLPSSQCGLTAAESITVTGRNNGTAAITALPLRYRVNGGAVVSETYSATIAPNATFTYTFTTPANLSAGGVYSVDAWASLPSDPTPANDSVLGTTCKNHIRVSTFPYIEDFESNTGGWFVTGTAPSWAWGTPAKTTIQGASSGAKAWVTGGLGNTRYADNEDNQVEGPCLDFSNTGAPWVGLDTWWNAEMSWDGANLQTSIDSGVTWVNVGQYGDPYNWYTDDAIDGQPGGSPEGWTGRASTNNGSNGWVRSVHGLAYLAGEPDVLVRITFASDGSVVDDGFAFDNFNVARQPTLYLGPDVSACDSAVLDAGPASSWSWSNGDTTRYTTVYQSGNYTAQIRDSFGFPTADIIQVTIDGPAAWDLGPDTVLCVANSYALAASGAASYAWSTGATTAGIVVTASGSYAVSATTALGCVQRDSVQITISDLEAAPGLSGTICRGVPYTFNDLSGGQPTSWYWDFGNGNLSVNQQPTTVYTSGGTFNVQLTVSDGTCTDDTTLTVLVDVCTGVSEGDLAQVQVYPVPARGQVWVRAAGDWAQGPVELRLLNALGQEVWRQRWEDWDGTPQAVPLDGRSKGAYWLGLESGGARAGQWIVVD